MDDLQSKDTQSPEVREQMLRALREGKLNQNDSSISEEIPENVQGEAEVTPAVNKDKSNSEISAAMIPYLKQVTLILQIPRLRPDGP